MIKKKQFGYGRLSLRWIFGLAFGALVGISILLVLYLAVMANKENTFSLLNDKAVLITRSLEREIRGHLDPAESVVKALKRMFDDAELSLDDPAGTEIALKAAVFANDAINVLMVTQVTGQQFGIYTSGDGKLWPFEKEPVSASASIEVFPTIHAQSPPVWGPLVSAEGQIFANVTVPLVRDGRLAAYLTAAVSMQALGELVKSLDDGNDATVFIIAGEDEIVAHSDVEELQSGGKVSAQLPASLEDVSDPVLLQMMQTATMPGFARAQKLGVSVRQVSLGSASSEFLVMTIKLHGYGPETWMVGEYFKATSVSREVHRLRGSAIAGGIAAGLAVLLAVWLSHRAARPLRAVAARARVVAELNFDAVKPLPRSRVRELDQVSLAFNAMVIGLKAMNTYVPRSLFNKLLRLGGADAATAREAELTMIFTDIVGFTSLSEHMSASQTAKVLNDHFAILVEAVEKEGGTVDKFVGDGMLAFWGAPDERLDHAQAAVRASQAIARAVRAANERSSDEYPFIRLRVGVHTGQAVVGNVGALDRWNYTVVGDAVNVSERLQSLGREISPDDEVVILASDTTVRKLSLHVKREKIGTHNLRGRRESVIVWRIREEETQADCADGQRNGVEVA